MHNVACRSQTEGHGHCQLRVTVWARWDWAVNLDRQSKTGGADLCLSYSVVLHLMGVNTEVNDARGKTQRCKIVGDDAQKPAKGGGAG